MKEKMISKVILVLIISFILLAMPQNIFATSSDQEDISKFWEDQSDDIKTDNTPTTPETPTQPTTTPETPTQPTTTPETQKPTSTPENQYAHAGIAEDTMMVVAVLALGGLAVFANKKVNEYNNI